MSADADGAADPTRHGRVPVTSLLLLFLASRLSLLLVGILSTFVIGSGRAVMKGNLVYHEPAPLPLEIWARWDSEWYLLIAAEGYRATHRFADLPVSYEPEAAAGFLPLYPLLVRALSPLLGGVGAGVLISNLCLAGSLALLYRLTWRAAGGGRGGRRAGLAACACLLLFPMSLFLSAVYAESLFLLLSLAVFDRIGAGRYAQAGLAGAAAALTRPFGVLLALPLAWEWWVARRRGGAPPSSPLGLAAALAPPAALGGFMIYCGRLFGDPLAFVHRQSRWRGAMSGPWRAFLRWWEAGPTAHGAHGSTLELLLAVGMLALLPLVARSLRPSWSIYAGAALVLPLCSTVWSYGRFALTAFPVFVALGIAFGRGSRGFAAIYGCLGATLSGLLMALFANWWWTG